HQGLAKSLDISIGMPTLFTNLAASRSWHISSQKNDQLRFQNKIGCSRVIHYWIEFPNLFPIRRIIRKEYLI
ncbi:MAG: hypothetical protein K8R28_09185, partial [Desulfobacterales bacterium]|nr:hypothetical protein [Desulfobacterales bacterium]